MLKSAVNALLISVLICSPGIAQELPRNADGKPNLSGIWQALTTANWNIEVHDAMQGPPELGAIGSVPPGLGIVQGGEIPYLPEARAKQQENFAVRWQEDPEIKCYMPGVPRANYLPQPFQIFHSPNDLLISYQFAKAMRIVNMSQHRDAAIDSWMGTSNGRWSGDTLIVDVAGLNGQQWLDRAGNHHSYQLQVEEHYTMLDANTMRYEATLTDPATYSRPWMMQFHLHRVLDEPAGLMEFHCVEFTEEFLYGEYRKPGTQPPPGN